MLSMANLFLEIEVSHVKCRTTFWGKKLNTPILISEYKDKCCAWQNFHLKSSFFVQNAGLFFGKTQNTF